MRHTPSGLVILSLLAACGGPATSDAGDSGVGDAGPLGPMVAPPDIPWLDVGVAPIAEPLLTPCPAGWSTVARADREGGPATCHPYDGEPDVCPDGSAHFVGDGACAPLGAPCPTGDFPEGLPTDVEVLYVLSSAPVGGDGTEASPLMTITDAMNIASPGTVIAIGKGTYDETLRVGPGITLWGACARETRVTASSPGSFALGIITVPSADVRLKNLRLGPADLSGVVVFGTRATVSIDGLLIEGTQRYGFLVQNGARVDARELSISGTRSDVAGELGCGLVVWHRATAEVSRALFTGNRAVGVFVADDGTVTLSDVVVEDTQEQRSDGVGGRGLSVQGGATADVVRTLFSRNRTTGVFVQGEGTSVTLSDVVVEDTREQRSDGTGGGGLRVQIGATADVVRTLFSRNRTIGVFVHDEGTSVTLSDVVVEDTQGPEGGGRGGWGLGVQLGATADVTRALFSGNREVGVLAGGDGASVTLSDVVVEETHGEESDGPGGWGLSVHLGATAEVTRALFSGNREIGVVVGGGDTSVTLSDVVVEDTQGRASDGTGGRGLGVQTGATAEVTRALFSGNREFGVFAAGDGASLTLMDVVVEDTEGQASDGTGGRGLGVQTGATAEVTRALFSGNREFGVLALDPGTLARLSDVVVRQTDERACAHTTCADRPFGVALAGVFEASLVATRFEALDSALCGVFVAEDGQVDLSLGEVSGSPIGACLQVDDYATARLTESVRYLNNGTNLDATSLPIPEPANPIDAAE